MDRITDLKKYIKENGKNANIYDKEGKLIVDLKRNENNEQEEEKRKKEKKKMKMKMIYMIKMEIG